MDGYRIDPRGRWGGRLTSRSLPERDDAIEALRDGERSLLASVWLGRAATERRVADSFAVIRDALLALRAERAVIELAGRAIDDEHRHAEICRFVASRFHGAVFAPPPLLPLQVPALAGASEELRHTLHVVGQCALNETTASAFLEACLDGARAGLARAALRELLSDEIDHARIGWMHLATASEAIRREAAPALLPMARLNLRMWRETPRAYEASRAGDALTAHGAPPPAAIEGSLLAALDAIILPGLDTLGIDSGPIRAWRAAGAPT